MIEKKVNVDTRLTILHVFINIKEIQQFVIDVVEIFNQSTM